jgi:hypothetical protein
MSDTTFTDMTPFFERYERRSRRVIVALVCASLAVAAGVFAYGAFTTGAPGAVLAKLWASIVLYPFIGVVLWTCTALYARSRRMPPGGRRPMNSDDARNAAYVANAGFTFVACVGLIMIATQAGLALGYFGVLQPLYKSGDWIARASVVASGVLIMYFGNAWAKTPMPRAPQRKAAAMMKCRRVLAWLMVIYGFLLGLAALFLPRPAMFVTTVVLSISLVLFLVASVGRLRNALNAQSPF